MSKYASRFIHTFTEPMILTFNPVGLRDDSGLYIDGQSALAPQTVSFHPKSKNVSI